MLRRRKMPGAPGIEGWDSMHTFTNDKQKQLLETHNKKYTPENFSDHVAHFSNFIESIRTGKPVVEDAVFGFRAAAPCLACNESYFQNKVIHWDAENMKLL